MDSLMVHVLVITPIVKLCVDLLRMALEGVRCRPWVTVLSAVLLGLASAICWRIAQGDPITAQSLAQSLFIGLLATAGAIGLTEAHKQARAEEPTPTVSREPASLADREAKP